MTQLQGMVLGIAEAQHDLVTWGQLRDLGVPSSTVHDWTERGFLTRACRGVYRVGRGELRTEQRLTVACLSAPRAVGSHGTAASIHGLRKAPRDRLELTIGHNDTLAVPNVLVHRSNRVDPDDIVFRVGGERITNVERTLFDMASVLDPSELRSMAQDAINKDLTNALSLAEIDRRLGGQGRPGAAVFHELVAWLGVDLPPVESDGELRLFDALERAGVHPVRQHWVTLRTGAKIRFDIALPPIRVGLEHDHSFWHSNPGRVEADKWRDIHARWVWWETHRFTELNVQDDLREIVAFVKFLHDSLSARRAA